jgi:hypothetical protein
MIGLAMHSIEGLRISLTSLDKDADLMMTKIIQESKIYSRSWIVKKYYGIRYPHKILNIRAI